MSKKNILPDYHEKIRKEKEIQFIEDPALDQEIPKEQRGLTKEQKEYLLALGCEPEQKETAEKIKECNSFGCYYVNRYVFDYSSCLHYKKFQKNRMPASIQILPARFIQYTTVKKTKQKINKNHHWQGGL